MTKYPELVTKLTSLCNGWIISAVDCENPRDYDIFIPIAHWGVACGMIPISAKIN